MSAFMLCGGSFSATAANNYTFTSGADSKETFGKSTETDTPASNPELENVRRNKDAADLPPSYGIFSGEIPTDASSPYHSNVAADYAADVTNYGSSSTSNTGVLTSTSMMGSSSASSSTDTTSNVTISQTTSQTTSNTTISGSYLYEDGSIGTIHIPALDRTITVYEGETLDNMKLGVGHFEDTSIWEGNVGVAGHNRGSAAYLSGIWNLNYGDEIIYTTKYGQRTYEVTSIEKISETDYSKLSWSNENMLTLITCVANESTYRWAVQAVEKQ